MINSGTSEYYHDYCGSYLSQYLAQKKEHDARLNLVLSIFAITIIIAGIVIARPIFANTITSESRIIDKSEKIYIQKNFEENIKNKYPGSYINFPTKGVAHIKQIKYINSKPISINIVELNTKINPNLKIKPQTASKQLNSKKTIRKIAQQEQAIIAMNGGFFKPQSGVPLGALMIDKEILTGPIYNRVGIAIFENKNETNFKMDNIDFDINAHTKNGVIHIDNINQPRMLSTYTLLYSSAWGKISPPPQKDGFNILIRQNKIIKISANPVPIEENDYVIQATSKIKDKLTKNNDQIKIEIKLQKGLEEADHIIGAGPYLVKDSEIYVDYKAQKLNAISGKNPRSAIGYKQDGTFIFVTIDGREKTSVGMTLYELAKFMKKIDCEYAMNFDGGSSSALYIKGKIVNKAINKEGIPVSNALIVNEINPNELQLSKL